MLSLPGALVRLIDRILRRATHIFEFSDAPGCILRIARTTSPRSISLSDGVRLLPGDPLIGLHLWNERVPRASRGKADLQWGLEFTRSIHASLQILARYLEAHREYQALALYGEAGFIEGERAEQVSRVLARLGFDVIPLAQPGWNLLSVAFWANLFSWWLMATFNPVSLEGKTFAHLRRYQLWMSRARLREKYLTGLS